MKISDKLSESIDLLDKFQLAVLKSKNNDNILNFIEKLTIDLEKYNSTHEIDKSDLEKSEIKVKVTEIINKIDDLNKIVLPKSKLSDDFIDYNSVK